MSVTLETSHFDMSPLNKVADDNMLLVSVTLDTSQFEMALLKDVADENITVIVAMLGLGCRESAVHQLRPDAVPQGGFAALLVGP